MIPRIVLAAWIVAIIASSAPVAAEQLTFKNVGKSPITIEFHRRGMKEEPNIPLPLKPGEQRNFKPQEDTFYGMYVTDDAGTNHRIGYRRMRGLTVKHPDAVIEVRPQTEIVEIEKETTVMVPVIKKKVDESGKVEEVVEYVLEKQVILVKQLRTTGYDVVLTKDGADELPLEFRKFVKPPKEEP